MFREQWIRLKSVAWMVLRPKSLSSASIPWGGSLHVRGGGGSYFLAPRIKSLLIFQEAHSPILPFTRLSILPPPPSPFFFFFFFLPRMNFGPTNFRPLYCDSVGKQRPVPVFLEKYLADNPLFTRFSRFSSRFRRETTRSNRTIDSYDLIKSTLLILVDDIGLFAPSLLRNFLVNRRFVYLCGCIEQVKLDAKGMEKNRILRSTVSFP